jgi:hypothetical protein
MEVRDDVLTTKNDKKCDIGTNFAPKFVLVSGTWSRGSAEPEYGICFT